MEAIPFSVPTFSLSEVTRIINISDSVTLLKIANLSCIHIPGDFFQSSKGYLETNQACR